MRRISDIRRHQKPWKATPNTCFVQLKIYQIEKPVDKKKIYLISFLAINCNFKSSQRRAQFSYTFPLRNQNINKKKSRIDQTFTISFALR